MNQNKWLTVLLVAVASIAFYFAVHFADQAHLESVQHKQDRQTAQLQAQNAALKQEQTDVKALCSSQQATWDTFGRVIAAATNPPSRAGTELTTEQQAAVAVYKQSLTDSIGKRPVC